MSERRAAIHRSVKRNDSVLFRMTSEDKLQLKARAAADGLTVQAYLERVALGRADALPLRSGRPRLDQRELPLTG